LFYSLGCVTSARFFVDSTIDVDGLQQSLVHPESASGHGRHHGSNGSLKISVFTPAWHWLASIFTNECLVASSHFHQKFPVKSMPSNEKLLMAIFDAIAESISTILNVAQDLPTEKLVWSD